MRFTRFACFDWSGQAVERPRGLTLAVADAEGPPRLVQRAWSRADALSWLRTIAASREPWLVGIDLSPTLPFCDEGAYFPDWPESPTDARTLWALVEARSAADLHLGIASFLADPAIGRYFRQHGGQLGDRFGTRGGGRLRVVEAHGRATGQGPATSCFNLIGPAQVGKSSLTGMRILHRLAGALPLWPIDPLPDDGPVLVEVYTTIAARAAGVTAGRSKIRTRPDLRAALAALGSPDHASLGVYDDHATDAIVTAAWLRTVAHDPTLWSPIWLTPAIARTEGWTFGIR